MTWLDKQIKDLQEKTSKFKEEINTIKNINPKICNEFQETTILKLICLNYSLNIYATIIHSFISNKKIFQHMFYVDLFSGSGLDRVKTKNYILIGSPFISVLNHKTQFTKFFFCEENTDFRNTLELRLDSLQIKNKEIYKDCNFDIDEIIRKIKEYPDSHIFFFIDPYSTEFEWNSMKKILSTYSDVLFTFMTRPIERIREASFAQSGKKQPTLLRIYGDDSWNNKTKSSVDIYKENILKIRPNGIVESINIGDYYDLIFVTNKTKGNNKWMQGIIQAKREIEKNSKEAVKISQSKYFEGQKDLASFFNTKKD